jgi:hypothetical protein
VATISRSANGQSAARPRGKTPQGVSPELQLRFTCPSCQHRLSAPLRSLGVKDACPGCAKPLRIPLLSAAVLGLDIVAKHVPVNASAPLWPTTCPGCHKQLTLTVTELDKPRPCPHCGRKVAVRLAAVADGPQAAPVKQNVAVAPAAFQPAPAASPSAPPPPAALPAPPPAIHNVPAVAAEPEPQTVYASAPQRASRGGGVYIPHKARWMMLGIHWIGMLLFIFLATIKPVFVLVIILWIIPFIGGKIRRALVRLLIPSFSCPGCGEVHECVGIWKCGCGYQDHRERHILSIKCPLCGNWLGGTACRRCGATILLW